MKAIKNLYFTLIKIFWLQPLTKKKSFKTEFARRKYQIKFTSFFKKMQKEEIGCDNIMQSHKKNQNS